jgi:hypothetical protein
VGFPTLKELTKSFKDNGNVKFLAVQTVFEGYNTNTRDKLRKNQLEYGLKIPMAHSAGDPQTHAIPDIMRRYRSGGTPWVVIIDPKGSVVYNDFHIKTKLAVKLIEIQLSGEQSRSEN